MGNGIVFFIFIPLVCYAFLILYLHLIRNTKLISDSNSSPTHVSIVVAMRNEEKNISRLLESLHQQDYPQDSYRVYIVDDHSTDRSAEIVATYPSDIIDLVRLPESISTKKKAIAYAMGKIEDDIVLFTDADCIVGKSWVSSLTKTLTQNLDVKMATGPVHILSGFEARAHGIHSSLFSRVQYLELAAMMYITKKGNQSKLFHLANGANMAVRTDVYRDVVQDIRYDLASGDDTFLIQAIEKRWPGSSTFLDDREAIVRTEGEDSMAGFISQRLRWAAKSVAMERKSILIVQAITWLTMLGFVVSFVVIPWQGVIAFLTYLLVLIVLDANLLLAYHKNMTFRWIDLFAIPLTAIFHAFYVLFIGLLSFFSPSYSWKGRKLR